LRTIVENAGLEGSVVAKLLKVQVILDTMQNRRVWTCLQQVSLIPKVITAVRKRSLKLEY
jgi:hypothetical protein